MRLRAFDIGFTVFACLLGASLAGEAWGQETPTVTGADVQVGYQGLPTRSQGSPQTGLQVSDSVLAHVGIGAEAGYDSNVFYGENDVRGSAIVRVIPFLELTNRPRVGTVPSGVAFSLGANLTYREYLSDDTQIRDQRAFMPSAFGFVDFSNSQALSLQVSDTFARTEDPPYLQNGVVAGPSFNRDNNLAMVQIRWAPGGGRLASLLRYTNSIDYFENGAVRDASSMGHALTLDASWKWLPKTALYVQVTQGYISYFYTDANGQSKLPSYPLHAMAGLRGLITAKLTLNLAAGYSNGFYATRVGHFGPSGLRGNLSAWAEVTYQPTLLTRIFLGYRHDFQNAILGDFYYLDTAYFNIGQAIGGRVGFGLSARYESRTFQGIPVAGGTASRHDNYWQGGANLDYKIRPWSYAGVAYTIMSNSSPYQPNAPTDPGRVNFVKQMIFARLGVSY